MKLFEIAQMPDFVLCGLYRQWSEDNYCAGWIGGGEETFIDWLLLQPFDSSLLPHEYNGVGKMRTYLIKLAEVEEPPCEL